MQPVSHLYHHTLPSWCPFHSLGLPPSVLCLPHADTLLTMTGLLNLMSACTHCMETDFVLLRLWHSVLWVRLHQNARDLKTCTLTSFHGSVFFIHLIWTLTPWGGLAYPILAKWMCFCSGTDTPGQVVLLCGHLPCPVWVMIPETRQSPPHARTYIPPCSGIDTIQQTVPCRDWPPLSRCTPASYARLLWMPFHPIQAVTPCRLYLTHAFLNSLGLSLCWDFPPVYLIFLCWGFGTLTQTTLIHHSHCNTTLDHYGFSSHPPARMSTLFCPHMSLELNYQEGGEKKRGRGREKLKEMYYLEEFN